MCSLGASVLDQQKCIKPLRTGEVLSGGQRSFLREKTFLLSSTSHVFLSLVCSCAEEVEGESIFLLKKKVNNRAENYEFLNYYCFIEMKTVSEPVITLISAVSRFLIH